MQTGQSPLLDRRGMPAYYTSMSHHNPRGRGKPGADSRWQCGCGLAGVVRGGERGVERNNG